MIQLGWIDWAVWVIYFTLILLLLIIYKNTKKDQELYKYFLHGFVIKSLAGFVFAMIYIYYYGFGDTFLYHNGATELVDTLSEDAQTYYRLMISDSGSLPVDLGEFQTIIPYSRTSEEWFMVKLLSPVNLIAFQSYLISTLLVSSIAFFGSWKLYQVFYDILPTRKKLAFVAAFLVPSVLFWGSGVLKDAFSLVALNYILYLLYFMLKREKNIIWSLIKIIILCILIAKLKSYIIIGFIPSAGIIIYLFFKTKITSTFIRLMLQPVLLGCFAFSIYYGTIAISEQSEKYDVEQLETQAKGFHSWHTTTAGSSYNLGEIEYTATGIIQKIPAALNVTFFRPYIWESKNAVVLISALEGVSLFILTLLVLYKWGFKFFTNLSKEPMLMGFFIYALLFGFAIGFTSYNFGALMRYKIPISSLIFFVLIYQLVKTKDGKKQNQNSS